MRRALELAREGWGQTAPNPMVGAVVVRDGQIVGEGYHARFGEAHAEAMALRVAGGQADGATVYVSLEPCRHHGKTPPCTDAILRAGVARVIMAAADPTAEAGGGAAVLRGAGVEVGEGMLEDQARELNAPFFHAARSDLPWVTLKLAVSLEMAIANARGTTSWLTGPEARRWVHTLRAGNDAIAVGIGTILADDPQLTVRDARLPRLPLTRVVFDRRLRIPATAAVVRTARETPTVVVTTAKSAAGKKAEVLRTAGVRVLAANGLRDAFRMLRASGTRSLLVEGGAALATAVMEEGLVHRLITVQAPVSLGAKALHAFDGASDRTLARLETLPLVERVQLGPDVATKYAVPD